MKRYAVILSKTAEKDIDNIFSYIEDISSKYDAKKVTAKIIKKAMKLDYFPERSEPFEKDKDGNSLRATVSGKYRIIYTVKRKEKEVIIIRIISVSRDLENL